MDDDNLRVQATKSLLTFLSESDSLAEDVDYTTKRLVRGLSSSRESARQGFSSCLTELVSTDRVSTQDIISAIVESTKVSGSLKKGEERDLMLGKLFGCLVLIKSGKLSRKEDFEFVAKSMAQLHGWKAWMKELVAEALLLLVDRIPVSLVVEVLLPLLKDWLSGVAVQDMAAWQIVLVAGLEQIVASKPALKRELAPLLPIESLCRPHVFEHLAPTLSVATAGYPKIHRVWTILLGYLFPLTKERVLLKQRSTTLTGVQEEFLRALVDFIDKHLIVNSHEKRGVGFHLLVLLVERCPALLLPVCLSRRITRSLFSARVNRKHTLHNVSSSVLKALVHAAGDDNEVRLSVSSILIQNCGANFDSLTKSNTIQALLEELSDADILRHVKSLCQLLGANYAKLLALSNSKAKSSNSKSNRKQNPQEDQSVAEEEYEDETSIAVASIHAIIDNLVSLAKNNKVSGRPRISAVASAVLMRVVFFSAGRAANIIESADSVSKSKKTKSSKKDKSDAAESPCAHVFGEVSTESQQLFDLMLECVALVEGEAPSQGSFPTEVTAHASTRLLTLLSESTRMNVEAGSSTADATNVWVDPLQSLTNFMELFHQRGYALSLGDTDGEDEDEDEAREDANRVLKLLFASQKKLKSALRSLSGGNKETSARVKLLESLLMFLNLAVFYSLSSEVIGTDVLEDLSEVTNEVLASTDLSIAPLDPDGADADASWQSRLFDACMDFLSVSEGQPVKGIRDAIRKLWLQIADSTLVDPQVIEALVAIISNEQEDGEEDEGSTEFDDEDAIEDDEDGVDSDQDEESVTKSTDAKPSKGTLNDDEVEIDEGDMFQLLGEADDENNDEDLRGMLQHGGTPEQDAALANLIELKKAGRKRGLLLAQKRQLLVRTRAVDILEVLLSPKQDATLVLTLTLPLVRTLAQLNADAATMTLQEARGFEQRVREILEEKICKGKHQSVSPSNYLASEDTIELLTELFVCLRSPVPTLKQVAFSCLFRITKVCNNSPEKESLQEMLRGALLEFKSRKNCKIPRKFFEDYFVRFPDFALETLADSVMSGCYDAKSPYLQTECCELISAVIHRFKTLSPPSQEALLDRFPSFLHALSQSAQALVVTRSDDGGGGSNATVAGKRLKVFLGCIKDALSSLKQLAKLSGDVSVVSPALGDAFVPLKALVNDISTTLQSDLKNGLNASINVLCQQSKQLVDELAPLVSAKRKPNAGSSDHSTKQNKTKKMKVAVQKQ